MDDILYTNGCHIPLRRPESPAYFGSARKLVLFFLAGVLLFFCHAPACLAQTWKATDCVNVRDQAGMDSTVITSLKKGARVRQTGQDGNWIAIAINGQTGYVYSKYLKKVPDLKIWVKADAVNLRKKPTTESDRLGLLYHGEKVLVLAKVDDWFKVKTGKGKVGFVCGEFMSRKPVKSSDDDAGGQEDGTPQNKKEKKKIPSFKPNERTGILLKKGAEHREALAKYRHAAIVKAKSYLGVKYSQKKRNKSGYADCSSLVRDVFMSATGEYIGDTTVTQAERMNEVIYPVSSVYDVRPGDLVYHLSGDNHTGIYLGNGKVLHASQSRKKVVISEFSSDGSFWEYGCNAALFCIFEK